MAIVRYSRRSPGASFLGVRLVLAAGLGLLVSCGRPTTGGTGSPAAKGPGSPAVKVDAASISASPLRDAARSVDRYMIFYGTLDSATIAIAQTYQLVIVHPTAGNITREQVAAIQGGTDPADPTKRVLVLGYISVGEDIRTAGLTADQMRADPRFVGDGTGPRIDPRGPAASGEPLAGIDPLGLPSSGGTGFASWYLNDNAVYNSPSSVGDGIPDRNRIFNACFVNAGDPRWFDVLQNSTLDGSDGVAGLQEILTTTSGRGLGCDGVFLDTIDTCGPNGWTGASSPNESKFEWTAPGFSAFVQRLRSTYPSNIILQNRGLFFFNPYLPQYQFTTRGSLDLALFESYRLNSGSTSNPDPVFYPDNRFNYAPKLMAEANRPDGFRVLSLGYAEGPPDQMSSSTLLGQSSLGYDSLIEDIRVTEQLAGFRHYLTDAGVQLVNTFVKDHGTLLDTSPPVWTSTYNDHDPPYPTPASEPTPRVGIQEVEPGAGSLTVRWDVALDMNRVHYALYYQTQPFDFAADPTLARATRVVLSPSVGKNYQYGAGPGVFPYEQTIVNLAPGQTYYLVIRAFDESPAANEEENQVVLSAAPLGTSSVLTRWRASNGVTSLTYRFQYTGSWTWARAYIDRDRTSGTGFSTHGLGAEYLIENGILYRYTGTGSTWSWAAVTPNPVVQTTGPIDGMTFVQWDFSQSDIGSSFTDVHLLFEVERPGEIATGFVYRHVYSSTDPSSPYHQWYAENDATRIYYHAETGSPFAWKHLFIDEDQDPSTGYPIGGIGAGYMIENGTLYKYTATAPNWGWTAVADAQFVQNGLLNDWSILRTDVVGATQNFQVFKLVFEANDGGVPQFTAPVYEHHFSP
jgi:hypothetical protein